MPAARRGTGVSLALAATMLLALVVGPSAIAKTKRFTVGNFQYAKESASIPPAGPAETTEKGASPTCSKGQGWKTTGGGGSPAGDPAKTRLTGTGFGSAREWFSEAVHTDSDRKRLTGYGVCVRKRQSEHFTDFSAVPAGPAEPGNSFGCPVDEVVFGGGVLLIGASEDWALNTTYPGDDLSDADDFPDNTWGADAFYTGGTPTSMLVDVVCGGTQPKYKTAETSLGTSPDAATLTAKCGSGHITGGGAYITGTVQDAYLVSSYPIDRGDRDKAPDDGWKATAMNVNGGPKVLTAYAICL